MRKKRESPYVHSVPILVAVAIGFLIFATSSNFRNIRRNAYIDAATAQLYEIRQQVLQRCEQTGARLMEEGGLSALVSQIARTPEDPWKSRYRYQSDRNAYKIWSLGPDRISGTVDDIVVVIQDASDTNRINTIGTRATARKGASPINPVFV